MWQRKWCFSPARSCKQPGAETSNAGYGVWRFGKKNQEMRVEAENGATAGKVAIAKKAKELGLDAIHDTVHEMARDEARHGKAFEGLLKRYFNK